MAEEKKKRKQGRPTFYTEELADRICKRIATHDIGIKRLCAMFPDMPSHQTINEWRWDHKGFADRYTLAKQLQAEILAEACLDIADDANNDWMQSLGDDEKSMGWKINGEHVQRSRLRIDTRKWIASKLAPKIYGSPSDDKDKNKPSELENILNGA